MSAVSTARFTARAGQRSTAALFITGVLLAWLFVPFVVSSAAAERLPIHTYTTEDGLAHANVRRIVRDPRGFLCFCTIDGLSRFDGAEFVTYRTGDGLPDPWVTDLLTTRDGTYWVATNGGVARFDSLTRHLPQDGQRRAERLRRSFNSVAFEGRQDTAGFASCWRIAPVACGRAESVGSSCSIDAWRRLHFDSSSRAPPR